jgi:hypothetical protein
VRQRSCRFFVPANSIIQPALTVTTKALANWKELPVKGAETLIRTPGRGVP